MGGDHGICSQQRRGVALPFCAASSSMSATPRGLGAAAGTVRAALRCLPTAACGSTDRQHHRSLRRMPGLPLHTLVPIVLAEAGQPHRSTGWEAGQPPHERRLGYDMMKPTGGGPWGQRAAAC